jgi:RNA-binding protein YlmH
VGSVDLGVTPDPTVLAYSVVQFEVTAFDDYSGTEPIDHRHMLGVGMRIGIDPSFGVVGDVVQTERS